MHIGCGEQAPKRQQIGVARFLLLELLDLDQGEAETSRAPRLFAARSSSIRSGKEWQVVLAIDGKLLSIIAGFPVHV